MNSVFQFKNDFYFFTGKGHPKPKIKHVLCTILKSSTLKKKKKKKKKKREQITNESWSKLSEKLKKALKFQ